MGQKGCSVNGAGDMVTEASVLQVYPFVLPCSLDFYWCPAKPLDAFSPKFYRTTDVPDVRSTGIIS